MITNISKDGSRVFFTVDGINYATNKNGCGIFREDEYGWFTNQTAGTCDFKLHQKTISGIRKALSRWFNNGD